MHGMGYDTTLAAMELGTQRASRHADGGICELVIPLALCARLLYEQEPVFQLESTRHAPQSALSLSITFGDRGL